MARLVQNRMQRHWFIEHVELKRSWPNSGRGRAGRRSRANLAQVHVALGLFYYYGYRQDEQALAEFERALQLQPNTSAALEYSGYVYRRQGQWQLRSMNSKSSRAGSAQCLDRGKF